MAKLQFSAPQAAPAHLSLRMEASRAGLSEDALRDLLWLMNAHPKMIVHDQIFHNVGRMLTSGVFNAEFLNDWASDWRSKTSDWVELCGWIWAHSGSLSRLSGLEEFRYRTTGTGESTMLAKHPIVNEGARRHAIPAAMWNIHETDTEALGSGSPPDAAKKYLALQAHVLAAYFECRSRVSDRAFYETYSGDQERPIAPVRTERISPGVREFSLGGYESLLLQLPDTPATPAFAEALQGLSVSFEGIQDLGIQRRARGYILGLRRYFGRYLKMLGGWKPPQSMRRGWGGGGGREKRHGYLRCLSAPGVYLGVEPAAPDDPELAHLVGQQVYIDRDSEADDDPDALEATGLAPSETLEHVFGLFSPEELGGRYLEKQRQRRAVIMRNQCLPFAYESLTPQEVRDIWRLADKHITRYLDTTPTTDALRQLAVSGLILKLSLAFGLRVENLAKLRLIWVASDHEPSADLEDKAEAAVLVHGTTPGDWSTARIVGILLPGIMPSYKTVLPDELEEVDGEYADNFVLPIAFGLDEQLLAAWRIHSPPFGFAFGVRLDTVRRETRRILKELQSERITLAKVESMFSRMVTYMTGDQSLAWVLTADQSNANEPRMFYTRHSVKKLQTVYHRAARSLGRMVEIRPPAKHLQLPVHNQNARVGARFVLSLNEIKNLIAYLKAVLKTRVHDRSDPEEIAYYHNHYMFYVLLYQAFESSIRAVKNPVELYESWFRQKEAKGVLHTSLADKTSDYNEKARLIVLADGLTRQFEHYAQHERLLCDSRALSLTARTSGRELRPFFGLLEDRGLLKMESITPSWITAVLEECTGYPIPANFHRAVIRTELLERECFAGVVDAFMGHANLGESPDNEFSSFDYAKYAKTLSVQLRALIDEIGFSPISSRLVPFSERSRYEA